ncbi:LysR family transcriptional regulator [Naumannella halotolerans]|uniref:DNA-binding transcriptional LysR family regulator n=1 Tax=Naumannella halotolerans TaxID=993414 RepID=A0A4R7J8B9_9ACTN|nr:LysR family transcriptional regulator [Naumannella halotolerans]TDT33730.1 DNA-binding transcriptional LysR family regulator [Naumannella halotolerans]
METRHLLLLRELADHGSVGATADALFVSPSAISQQLRAAESELGEKLVRRHGRGIRLTEAGQLLAGLGADVATELARAERVWSQYRQVVGGTVRLAVLPSAGVVVVPSALQRLGDSGVRLEITDHDVDEAGYAELARDHDLVIGHRMGDPDPSWSGLVQTDLFREPLDIAVAENHRLAGATQVSPVDLRGERWIGVPHGYPFDDLRTAIERRAGAPFEVVQRLRDNRLVESLVVAGQGIGLLPRFSTRPTPGLVLLPLRGVRTGRVISLLSRPDRMQRGPVRTVAEIVAEVSRDRLHGAVGPRR